MSCVSNRETYESLLGTVRGGPLVHVDETWAKVKGASKRGYVWVFASPDVAVYVYSPTREGDTLRETLTGFKGVLVSDFYAAYDTMDCQQQKCLFTCSATSMTILANGHSTRS